MKILMKSSYFKLESLTNAKLRDILNIVEKNIEGMLSDEEGSMCDIIARKIATEKRKSRQNKNYCSINFYFNEDGKIEFKFGKEWKEKKWYRRIYRGIFKISSTSSKIYAYFLEYDNINNNNKALENIMISVEIYNRLIKKNSK